MPDETTHANKRKDRPNVIPWPPILLLLSVIVGFALNIFYPLPFPGGFAGEMAVGFGLMFLGLAIAMDLAAIRTMHKARTAILPNKGASQLVTSGIFQFSRNPIYLANVMLIFGLGLYMANFWLLAASFVNGFLTRKLAIEREEAHLEAKFGKAYRTYKSKVNRWF